MIVDSKPIAHAAVIKAELACVLESLQLNQEETKVVKLFQMERA